MKRHKTSYPGIFYREVDRLGGPGKERVYYIVFKKAGKVHEEKVGRRRPWARLPRPATGLSCQCCIKTGGSILNGRYWYHIAFPFTRESMMTNPLRGSWSLS